MTTPKATPGASRLPIPSRFNVRPSALPVSPATSTPRSPLTFMAEGTAARQGFASPKAVWSNVSAIQRPKYQLQDPGVSSPVATAVKGGRSTLPRPTRLAPATIARPVARSKDTETSISGSRSTLTFSRTPITTTPKPTIRPAGSAVAKKPPTKERARGAQDSTPTFSKPSSVTSRSSLPTPQARRIPVPRSPSIVNVTPNRSIPSIPRANAPITLRTPVQRMKSPIAKTPRHPYTSTLSDDIDIELDKTPTMESRQPSSTSISGLSTTSTTASSAYSSASSMARARAAEAERRRNPRPDSSHEGTCAPYLVPTNGPEMTLAWQPDTERMDDDPAEEVWKTLERKLGRRLRGDSVNDRGRWVVQALQEEQPPNLDRGIAIDLSSGMEKSLSDFTVSAYSSMTDEEGTALFDMSAPLIPSVSTSAATPANTPCFRSETLVRQRHIRRRQGGSMCRTTSAQSNTSRGSGSSSGASVMTDISHPASELMYRLDSHVISALSALQGVFDSPDLDIALGLDDDDVYGATIWDGRDVAKEKDEGGLGLGMHIKLSSVYTLPTLPRMRKSRNVVNVFDVEGGEDVMMVKDLDTGLVQAISMEDE